MKKARVLIDERGFSALETGKQLTFIMKRGIVDVVSMMAATQKVRLDQMLIATIVNERINPQAPIFIRLHMLDRGYQGDGHGAPAMLIRAKDGRLFTGQLGASQGDKSELKQTDEVDVVKVTWGERGS